MTDEHVLKSILDDRAAAFGRLRVAQTQQRQMQRAIQRLLDAWDDYVGTEDSEGNDAALDAVAGCIGDLRGMLR